MQGFWKHTEASVRPGCVCVGGGVGAEWSGSAFRPFVPDFP